MAVRKIKNSWWVDFQFNFERIRKRSPANYKAGAEAYESVLRQKLARGELLELAKPDKNQQEREQKFKEFAWKWFETYVKTNNKHSEISRKKYTLRTKLIPFFGETPIDKIDTLQVEQYKSKKTGEGLTNKTVNNHLTVLSSCLRTAQEWFELKKIPKMKNLKMPLLKIDFLSRDECELLLANTKGVWREIIFTALKTGLRRGELKGLNWSDINWNNKTLTVRHSWCDYKKGLDTPKSNRERHIPLTDELYEMLVRRRQATGFVFVDERNQRFAGKRLNQEISDACKIAGIREVTCHTLRHTFASHLTMAGASMKAIQELMGHAHIQTTMRYAHLGSSSLRETVNLLEPVKGMPMDFGQLAVNSGNGRPPDVPSNGETNSLKTVVFQRHLRP